MDINRDGAPDLLVGDGGGLSVLNNAGDGSFPVQGQKRYAATGYFAVSDLNADGAPDVLLLESTSSLRAMLNRGDGTFDPVGKAAPLAISLQARVPSPTLPYDGVALDDFDGDGIADVAGVIDVNRVGYFWNRGPNDFGGTDAAVQSVALPGTREVMSVRAVDLDRNGTKTLILRMKGSYAIAYYEGRRQFPVEATEKTGNYPELIDVNGDKLLDLVLSPFPIPPMRVFPSLGPRQFSDIGYATTVNQVPTLFVDLDSDGRTDILFLSSSAGQIDVSASPNQSS